MDMLGGSNPLKEGYCCRWPSVSKTKWTNCCCFVSYENMEIARGCSLTFLWRFGHGSSHRIDARIGREFQIDAHRLRAHHFRRRRSEEKVAIVAQRDSARRGGHWLLSHRSGRGRRRCDIDVHGVRHLVFCMVIEVDIAEVVSLQHILNGPALSIKGTERGDRHSAVRHCKMVRGIRDAAKCKPLRSVHSARTLITQLGVALIAHSLAVPSRFDVEGVVRGERVRQHSDHGEELIVDKVCEAMG